MGKFQLTVEFGLLLQTYCGKAEEHDIISAEAESFMENDSQEAYG